MKITALKLAVLLVATMPAQSADGPAPAFTREHATAIIENWRKIVTPSGLDERLEIAIGGTKQWISVRGRDKRNPIILMIHGGPASPEMPTSWTWQGDWEDYFTVVQWDQRGSGKSFVAMIRLPWARPFHSRGSARMRRRWCNS